MTWHILVNRRDFMYFFEYDQYIEDGGKEDNKQPFKHQNKAGR